MARPRRPVKPFIGWREWLELPELGPDPVKAKIDTGARTSALHAFGLEIEDRRGVPHAHFELHPMQRSSQRSIEVARPIEGFRPVRSSNGRTEQRPVIVTTARLGDVEWPIEITLTSRDEMGFRMLLGRAAVRDRFVVDPGRSYLLSKRTRDREQM
ncbi:MAG: RimK/LysX family protein [Acidimicrobiia bacterium]|nr:RimK/LysX family protein [Acidimicrobiia bacterium]